MSWQGRGAGGFSSPILARSIGSLLILASLGLLYLLFFGNRDVGSSAFMPGFEAVGAFAMGILVLRLPLKRSDDETADDPGNSRGS